jgi:hypothetical protein
MGSGILGILRSETGSILLSAVSIAGVESGTLISETGSILVTTSSERFSTTESVVAKFYSSLVMPTLVSAREFVAALSTLFRTGSVGLASTAES